VSQLFPVIAAHDFGCLPRAGVGSDGAVFAFTILNQWPAKARYAIALQNERKLSAIIGRDEICCNANCLR